MRKRTVLAIVGVSFFSLVAVIVHVTGRGMLTLAAGRLMVIALVGLYLGFGVLIIVYRLINKLDHDEHS